MKAKDVYIAPLEHTIESLELQVDNLTELIKIPSKERFGFTSEEGRMFGQFSVINEAEAEASENTKELAKFFHGVFFRYIHKRFNAPTV